jgi:hypothetical protein
MFMSMCVWGGEVNGASVHVNVYVFKISWGSMFMSMCVWGGGGSMLPLFMSICMCLG